MLCVSVLVLFSVITDRFLGDRRLINATTRPCLNALSVCLSVSIYLSVYLSTRVAIRDLEFRT